MVIAVADVERWVQPDLVEKKTTGEAFVYLLMGSSSAAAVVGPAGVVLDARSVDDVAVEGVARVVPLAYAQAYMGLIGNAVVTITAPVTTNDYQFAAAGADIRVVGRSTVDAVVVNGDVLFGVYDRTSFAVAVEGLAEISFGDFGQDVPIFPMTFPFAFTQTDLLPWGTAYVEFDNAGSIDAVEVSGDATVRITSKTRLNFQGSIPVFPFGFPAVFDSEANVRLGTAPVGVGGVSPSAVAVDGVAHVPIYGASYAIHQTVFAFQFPAVFDSRGVCLAAAVIDAVSDATAAVAVDADASVSVGAACVVGSSAVFPWIFGVIFG